MQAISSGARDVKFAAMMARSKVRPEELGDDDDDDLEGADR